MHPLDAKEAKSDLDTDLGLVDFSSRKERKFACPNALEFVMTTMMFHNNDQEFSMKIPEPQSETVAAKIMLYSILTIQSRKKKTHTYCTVLKF